MVDWILSPITLRIAILAILIVTFGNLALMMRTRWQRLRAIGEQRASEREIWRTRMQAATAQLRRVESQAQAWSGFRKFRVENRIEEAPNVVSFELKPHDRKLLPRYRPGQFLTFKIQLPGENKPIRRCYSLSDAPFQPQDLKSTSVLLQPTYRITIKRLTATDGLPEGRISTFFHESVQVGSIVDVMAPSGHFTLDPDDARPVVFLAAGIGLTPLFSMLRAACQGGRAHEREMWFFHGLPTPRDHLFSDALAQLAKKHDNVHLHLCYSQLDAQASIDKSYQHRGRIHIDLLKRLLPSNNYQFMLCGPQSMMAELSDALRAWGVPDRDIQREAFSSASTKTSKTDSPMTKAQVSFAKSNLEATWESDSGSLLEFAEQQGVPIDSGCRAGSCGACSVAIRSGQVTYLNPPGTDLEDGTCLACIAVPQTDVVIDA